MLMSGANGVLMFHIFTSICPSMTFNVTLLFDLNYEFPPSTFAHFGTSNVNGKVPSWWKYICMPFKREGLSTQLNSLWSAWVLPSIPPLFHSYSTLIYVFIPLLFMFLFISLYISNRSLSLPVISPFSHFTTLFPILLSFSALPLCLQSIPSAAPLSPLLSVSPLIQYELLS